MMGKLLNSKFETYLMDQELTLRKRKIKMKSSWQWCNMSNIQKDFLQAYNEYLMGYVERDNNF